MIDGYMNKRQILPPIKEIDLKTQKPKVTLEGKDLTIIASGYSSFLVRNTINKLKALILIPKLLMSEF